MGAEAPDDSPAEPRTVIGRWLLAALLNQREARQKLSRMLNNGKYDEPAVVEIACEISARRYFSSDVDVRAITAFVAELRGRVHSTKPPGQLETEALIRLALGDPDVVVSGIAPMDIFNIQSAVVAQVPSKLNLDQAGMSKLILQAEQIAFQRGWNPPLASLLMPGSISRRKRRRAHADR